MLKIINKATITPPGQRRQLHATLSLPGIRGIPKNNQKAVENTLKHLFGVKWKDKVAVKIVKEDRAIYYDLKVPTANGEIAELPFITLKPEQGKTIPFWTKVFTDRPSVQTMFSQILLKDKKHVFGTSNDLIKQSTDDIIKSLFNPKVYLHKRLKAYQDLLTIRYNVLSQEQAYKQYTK